MPDTGDLNENATDQRARALRAVSGLIPGAGSFVVEYLVNTIPNQRMDRFAQFLEMLVHRVEKLEAQSNINSPRFVELFEEAAEHAARTYDVHRAEYLTRIVIPDKPTSPEEWDVRRKLLQILRELTDKDIEILLSFSALPAGLAGTNPRRRRPERFLSVRDRKTLGDKEIFEIESGNAHFELHVSTLEKLGLLSPVARAPDLGRAANEELGLARALHDWLGDDGRPKIEGHKITRTGRLLIGTITGSHPR